MDNEQNEDLSPHESLKLISKMMDKVQDDALWKIAKKRSTFKLTLVIYFLINVMLVGLWYFTTGPHSYFWPAWPMLGWGFGVAFQFVDAYISHGIFSEDKEFEKLKKKTREEQNKNQ